MTSQASAEGDATSSSTDGLLPLRGTRCARCGFVSVPVQTFGCLTCGAFGAELRVTNLRPGGTVLAAVTVHQHPDKALAAPFVVGSVHLDDGPMVRARLREDVRPHDRVCATNVDGTLVFARNTD